MFSVSSCVHVNSLIDCAESFSSVVFFLGFGEPHRQLPFLIIFCGGKSLCTISVKLSLRLSSLALWDPV